MVLQRGDVVSSCYLIFYTFGLASIFLRMRRSSMKQSPEVVQRTQPIIMITLISIRAGSCVYLLQI
jgi:hypothetical protein